MEVSKENAREFWCPMVRTQAIPGEATIDNRLANWTNPNCIANKCMMWEYVNGNRDVGYCGLSVRR